MVTIIKMSYSIRKVLNYNENKIKTGVAECIGAENYPLDLERLNFTLKLNRFLNRASLNKNAKCTTVHISVNFHPSENHSKEVLVKIVNSYMEKIGFGSQPYLIYQHYDAGHPHLHVVTNTIQRNGIPINIYNAGFTKLKPAREETEKLFGLVKAEGRKCISTNSLHHTTTSRIQYGKTESLQAVSAVLDKVLIQYKYSNFSELNAILKQYNVMADRGREGSKMFNSKGLLYRMLDAKGKSIGVPIKASNFNLKPTIKFLMEKFQNNEIRKTSDEIRIKYIIDKTFFRAKYLTIKDLTRQLEKEGITIVLKRNKDGLLQDITYVDYKTQNVFNGNKLGEKYSSKAIEERCESKPLDAAKVKTPREKLTLFKTITCLEANNNGKKHAGIGL